MKPTFTKKFHPHKEKPAVKTKLKDEHSPKDVYVVIFNEPKKSQFEEKPLQRIFVFKERDMAKSFSDRMRDEGKEEVKYQQRHLYT